MAKIVANTYSDINNFCLVIDKPIPTTKNNNNKEVSLRASKKAPSPKATISGRPSKLKMR